MELAKFIATQLLSNEEDEINQANTSQAETFILMPHPPPRDITICDWKDNKERLDLQTGSKLKLMVLRILNDRGHFIDPFSFGVM
jgi:hypothetical protein